MGRVGAGYESAHMRSRVTALIALLFAVATSTAVAATAAPTASTGPVTSVAPTTATVSGSVNPNGSATTWYVEYGTSTNYGTKTSSASAGSGTTGQAVSASLTSLKPGTTYHYRFVATSSAGTGRGSDGILTTSSSAPTAVTSSASNITPTSATLNGTVDPSGRPTTWYVEYGTSTGYGTKTAAKDAGSGTGAAAVSAPVTGLTTGRTYHFRLVATNDAGTSRGSDQTFVASAAPTVTAKAASSVKDTSATLNGSVNPNGQATSVYFEYGATTSYGTKTPAASAGSGTSTKSVSAAVTGLAGGATYHFRLVATNASGTATGADQTFTTPGRPVSQTGTPSGVSGSSATLTGTVDPAGHSTNWYFDYGTTTAYGTKTAAQNAGSSAGARAVSFQVAGLVPATTYHFRLVATNSAGTGYGADGTFTTVGPAVTIAASGTTVVYGRRVTLRGTVASKQANASVAVFASRLGTGSFTAVATVLTGAGGGWSLSVKPPIRTTYKALVGGGTAVTTVSVRPAVSLAARSNVRFATRVSGTRSFAGRVVQLQRHRLDGSWLTIGRTRLSTRSTAVFQPRLPRGRSVLRVALGAEQAGSGYLAGYSGSLPYRRR
jgi:phosphodiesterase/alkaline phosphatase D-like protein